MPCAGRTLESTEGRSWACDEPYDWSSYRRISKGSTFALPPACSRQSLGLAAKESNMFWEPPAGLRCRWVPLQTGLEQAVPTTCSPREGANAGSEPLPGRRAASEVALTCRGAMLSISLPAVCLC